MAWRPDHPVMLPNGRLVCSTRGLVICHYCTVDYSFMDESETVRMMIRRIPIKMAPPLNVFAAGPERRVGTKRTFPTKFKPPNQSDTPESLFPLGRSEMASPPVYRFIHRNDNNQFLIYTDGACLDNGGVNPRAGCSFVYRNSTSDPQVCGYVDFPLEKQGPTGIQQPQTSNRAELRAVIAALRFRYWLGEGCTCLVIATDSEYVVEGITKWVKGWIRNNWKTKVGAPVKNQDLWKCLLGEVKRRNEEGMQIQFWRIPREWNTEADQRAKEAANKAASQKFEDILGLLV
ncbi:uncharacterized protein N7500_006446 [Penicillium coprophilum]|uniref:uncharacterized protein n=1 Tax=Penicillium coprophilum TaxID=36646 RepID=UPI0023A0BC49|nr:uncharacterized protein N7500_006446 [Penicillium coprophilum]KAJ5164616.1 hypothetical protein N7500_006446 [Penicillium coprophilum]